MKTQEISTEYGFFQYAVIEGHIMLTEYRGRDISLTVPVNIDGLPVSVIGKKAFLGAKGLKELVLPRHINTIQDWAFAFCSSLETITLPGRRLGAGQGIFKDCVKLRQIIITDKENRSVSCLFAAAVTKLDAFYLFNPETAGSREWLEQWDLRMCSLMEQDDAEGFSKMLLCGEEDYGSRDNNLDYYVEQRRRFKVRLAMLRLMNDTGLEAGVKNMLLTYLQMHKKGESSEETWKVVLEEHGDEKEYYEFLLDNGCITNGNIDAVLEDMGEHHTEMKAFLMNCRNDKFPKENVFEALEFEL